MKSSLSDEDLRRIEERANAALPGPWVIDGWKLGEAVCIKTVPEQSRRKFEYAIDVMSVYGKAPTVGQLGPQQPHVSETASFIAHAREDVPRLIAEIRRLRK